MRTLRAQPHPQRQPATAYGRAVRGVGVGDCGALFYDQTHQHMTKEQAMNQAIDRIKGQEIQIGTIVASRDEPRTWQLDGYDDIYALLSIGDEKRKVLRSEVFDVKKVINVANHLLNLGFWNEGMESIMLTGKAV